MHNRNQIRAKVAVRDANVEMRSTLALVAAVLTALAAVFAVAPTGRILGL